MKLVVYERLRQMRIANVQLTREACDAAKSSVVEKQKEKGEKREK